MEELVKTEPLHRTGWLPITKAIMEHVTVWLVMIQYRSSHSFPSDMGQVPACSVEQVHCTTIWNCGCQNERRSCRSVSQWRWPWLWGYCPDKPLQIPQTYIRLFLSGERSSLCLNLDSVTTSYSGKIMWLCPLNSIILSKISWRISIPCRQYNLIYLSKRIWRSTQADNGLRNEKAAKSSLVSGFSERKSRNLVLIFAFSWCLNVDPTSRSSEY